MQFEEQQLWRREFSRTCQPAITVNVKGFKKQEPSANKSFFFMCWNGRGLLALTVIWDISGSVCKWVKLQTSEKRKHFCSETVSSTHPNLVHVMWSKWMDNNYKTYEKYLSLSPPTGGYVSVKGLKLVPWQQLHYNPLTK